MKLIWQYVRSCGKTVTFNLIIKFLGTMTELLIPYVLSHIIDKIVPLNSVSLIVVWGIVMIVISGITMLLNAQANRIAVKIARDATQSVRQDLFKKIMYLSGTQTDKFSIPSLESRITSDTYNFYQFIGNMLRMGIRSPIMLVGGILISLTLDPMLTLVMVAILPFIGLAVLFISKKGIPLYRKVQKSLDGMVRIVREDAQGIRVIKSLSKVDYERERFDKANANLSFSEKKAGITMAATNPLMVLFMNLGLAVVIFTGAIRVDSGNTSPGVIIAFMQYFTLISAAMMGITRMFVRYTKAAASADRIAEVLNTVEDLPVYDMVEFPPINTDSHICFSGVSFSYNKNKNNLTDINLIVKRGESLGIIGATGSGKSTIVQLLMRIYDTDSGNIYIGGQDIRTMEKDKLHTMFGVVLQNDFVFSDTVGENIKFGRDLTDEQVRMGAETAQADFIGAFDDGFEHHITSKGTNISGGQKQRILLARAMATEPDILILDDSSSALDYKTDANLRTAIKNNYKGITSIIVAQRVSSIMSCNHIVVVDEGTIIGEGTHKSLLESCDVYREISNSQMGGAILE